MKDFSHNQYDFATISTNQKIVYSMFLGFVVLGYVWTVVFFATKTGWTPSELARYYRGDEATMRYPKGFGELWEITHAHLFSIPILFLVLAHLFMMTQWSERDKVICICLAGVGILADLASPWLIRYASPAFVLLKLAGRWLTLGTVALLIGVPFYEMWFTRPEARRDR